MLLRSPNNLHYPITVTELLKEPKDNVDRLEPLFSYSYKSIVTEGDEYGDERQVERTFPTRFESEAEGVILRWKISKGSVINSPDVDLVEIEEPCRHEQQFGGMCAICGKDMTEVNYNTSKPDTERAKINMTHGSTALLLSDSEAARIDDETKRRLLSFRKLSLVVDLDQTIIHATVDPTVSEWQNDPSNPNHDAVKDVEKFQLVDDGPGRGCWYYIKLRPGLREFLQEVAKLYELHIYTMGTRAYAQNIAKIVDPEDKIFGQRILSRDESGSLTVKSLGRLFPIDTKMVVIIDDRGDVWQWTENLVKVTPYDFFVGIGDINSSFLPRRTEPLPPKDEPIQQLEEASSSSELQEEGSAAENENQTTKSTAAPESEDADAALADDLHESTVKESHQAMDVENPSLTNGMNGPNADLASTLDPIISMVALGMGGDAEVLQQQAHLQDEEISSQLTDRPLLQKQKILDEAEEKAQEMGKEHDGSQNGTPAEMPHYRHNLLQDDDVELGHLKKALRNIHRTFFDEYDRRIAGSQGGRIAELRGEKVPKRRPYEELLMVPDVKEIMPAMKEKVLGGLQLCFTGVVPLGIPIQFSDLGRWAISFGAEISDSVTSETTHVIATKNRRTAKVRAAARTSAFIVTTGWLFSCFTQWKRVDEEPYLIHSDVNQSSNIDTSAFDALTEENNLTLSDEDEDGSDSEGDDSTQLKLVMEDVGPSKPPDDESPIEELEDADWKEMWAEFNDIPSDGESDAGTEDESDNSEESRQGGTAKPQKRKRGGDTTESTDNEDSDASVTGRTGSKLQRRKKRAMERTSSLQDVETAGRTNGTGTTLNDQADDIGNDDDDDDGFGAEFEADLEAQLMESDNEGGDGNGG